MTQPTQPPPVLRFHEIGGDRPVEVRPRRLVVAGYTGADRAAVDAHIAELAALGVAPPATVPAFYDLDPRLLTQDSRVRVAGPLCTGEVEPVLVRGPEGWLLTVGSDLTDRDLERADVAASKGACAKPVGRTALALGDDPAVLSGPAWEDIAASSLIDGALYQKGDLASLRPPHDVLARLADAVGDGGGGLVVFGGTLPLIDGEFRAGGSWELRLDLPGGAVLAHHHQILFPGSSS